LRKLTSRFDSGGGEHVEDHNATRTATHTATHTAAHTATHAYCNTQSCIYRALLRKLTSRFDSGGGEHVEDHEIGIFHHNSQKSVLPTFNPHSDFSFFLIIRTIAQNTHLISSNSQYGVATVSRLLKMMDLFCRISSLLYGSFAKETYNFKEPTNRSHLIVSSAVYLQSNDIELDANVFFFFYVG